MIAIACSLLAFGVSVLRRKWLAPITVLPLFLGVDSPAAADRFVIVDQAGQQREIVGRLHGSGQGAYAIELPSGELEIVAQGAVLERDNTVEWVAQTPAQVVEALSDQFGPETFRHEIDGNFVIGLVLMDELPKQSEIRVTGFLRKAARFMNNVQNVFLKYGRELQLDLRDPDVPLVLLIFESDDDFNRYTQSVTKGQGLSAGNIAGFYNAVTNFLAIRMTECTTFEVPLHEAIHQQVFNRGVIQRLAPVPAWFNEGLAAGFEANGDRINAGPTKVHSRYAQQYATAGQVTWDQLIIDDRPFQGDVLAGDAYCHGWALHWLLVTKYDKQYANYVKTLSTKQPLAKQDPDVRRSDFETHFGDDLPGLKEEFLRNLQRAMRTQRVRDRSANRPGYLTQQKGLADLEMTAITRLNQGGFLEVEGRLKNINPFRNLAFCVTVLTDGGTYARWIVPNLAPRRMTNLPKKFATDTLPGTRGQASQTFRVFIDPALPDGTKARQFLNGEYPLPNQ